MMSRPSSREILGALAGLGALLLMILTWSQLPPRIDRQTHAAIGQALGREALHLLGPGGGVTIITRDTTAFPQPAIDILLESFKREVSRANGRIAATRLIQADPIRPAEVPPGDFFELIQRSSTGDVIVSLLGPPIFSEDQRQRLRQIKPRIVAFCSGNLAENLNLGPFFEAGLLHAAVISRPLSALGREQPMGANRFDQLYKTVRARDLAASSGASQAVE